MVEIHDRGCCPRHSSHIPIAQCFTQGTTLPTASNEIKFIELLAAVGKGWDK